MFFRNIFTTLLCAAAALGCSAAAAITGTTHAERLVELVMKTDLSPNAQTNTHIFTDEPLAADMKPGQVYTYSSKDADTHACAIIAEHSLQQAAPGSLIQAGETKTRTVIRVYSSTDRNKLAQIRCPRDSFIHTLSGATAQVRHLGPKVIEYEIKNEAFTDYENKNGSFYYKVCLSAFEVAEFSPLVNEGAEITAAHEAQHYNDYTLNDNTAILAVYPSELVPFLKGLNDVEPKNIMVEAINHFNDVRKHCAINLILLEGRATDAELRAAEKLGLIKNFDDIDKRVAERNKVPIDASALGNNKNLNFEYLNHSFNLTTNGKLCTYGQAYKTLSESLAFGHDELNNAALKHKEAIYRFFAHYHKHKYYQNNLPGDDVHTTTPNQQTDWDKEVDIVNLLEELTKLLQESKNNFDTEKFNKLFTLINPLNTDTSRTLTCYQNGIGEYRKARAQFLQTALNTVYNEDGVDVQFTPHSIIPKTITIQQVGVLFHVLVYLTEDLKGEEGGQIYDQSALEPYYSEYSKKCQARRDELFEQYEARGTYPPNEIITKEETRIAKEHWKQNKADLLFKHSQKIRELLNKNTPLPNRVKIVPRP